MTLAIAATWAFAALLAVAGVRKVADPAATGAALQGARLPSDRRLVRLLGVGEVALAAAVLLVGGWVPALLVAVAYAAFAMFAHRQSRRGAGCGCFGEADAPASRLHVLIDVCGAVAGAAAAAARAPSLLSLSSGGVVDVVLAALALVVATAALRLALTALPELAAAVDLAAPEETA